jgi:esterase/lipase superfamily enzyme
MYYVITALIISALLSGCASMPLARTTSYFRDLYKRIPYTIKGNYRVIDIFYATDRQPITAQDGSASFGSEMAPNRSYRKLNVKIDPGLTIGTMLPEHLKKHDIIGLQEAAPLDSDAFMKQLSEAVKASPHNSLLVVVFGYKDGYEATAIKAAYFAYLLDVNTPVLLFDWPGDQGVSIDGYKKAQSLARASGPQLGELLTKITREVKPAKLWVKASSLGCQVVCDAFDHMYKYEDMKDADREIAHVIFAAPDVGKEEFETEFKNEIAALAEKVTVYVSSNDTALLMSGLINMGERLGRQDIQHEHEETEEAKDILYLKSLDPEKITLIDVTPINKSSYSHGYYLEDPEFFDDVYTRFFDKEPNVSRRLYLLKYKDNVDYWVMRSEK